VTEAYALYNPSMSGQDENMGSRVEDSVYAEKSSDLWEKGFVKYLTRQNLREKDSGYDALLKKYVEEEGIEEESDQQYLRMKINGDIVIQSGGDAEDVSAQGTGSWLSDTDTVSITSVTEGGYALAIDRFDEEKKIEEKVTFNAKVVKVNYENDLVKIEYIQDGTDAKMVLAQTVLVTVPLGVLQSGDIEFSPTLPKRQQDAIDSMRVGVLDKLIMYWDDYAMESAPNFQANWDEVSKKEWLQLITPETETSEFWTCFFNTRRFNGLHTMTAWIGGSDAKAMELMEDQAILDIAVANLKTMFGSDVAPPTKFMITRWFTDEFSKGSYSFRSVDLPFDNVAKKISESVKDKVFFAGEHTSDAGWAGTAVGAFETGDMAAKAMARSIDDEVLVSIHHEVA